MHMLITNFVIITVAIQLYVFGAIENIVLSRNAVNRNVHSTLMPMFIPC